MIPKKRKEKLLLLLLLEEEGEAIIAPSKQLAPSEQIYFLLSINLLSGQWLPPYFEAFFLIFLFGKQWLPPCFEAFVLETMTFLDLSFIHAFSLDCLTFSYGKFVSAIPLRNFAMIQT